MDTFFTLSNAKNYGITLAVFLVIDMVWLLFVAKNLYAKQLGYLMAEQANLVAAFVFYALFVVGLLFFVINPALAKESWQYALLAGMFFGLITYATYDLTNLATVKDWPLTITVIDLIWGTSLSGATSAFSYWIIRALS
jgi:uncharacterized membrane protein